MKKRIFKSLLFVISLLFSLTACNGIFQQKASSDEKVVLSISVKSNVNGTELNLNSRTASVSAADELAYYKSLVYTLTAVDSDSNQVTLLESYSYDDFIEAAPEIDPGQWTFTLEAVDPETKTSVLTGSCAKSISADDSFVSFTLQTAENLTGTIELKIVYASDYVTENESGEAVYPDFSLVIHQAKYTDGSFPVEDYEFKCTAEGNSESDGLYSNTYQASYPVGKCLVYAFYNDNIVYSDLFYVSPNLTTSAEFTTGDAVKAVTTYTYHQEDSTFVDYCKTGEEYTLKSSFLTYGDTKSLEGWYDNEEYSGNPVTKITAGEDKDFYGKIREIRLEKITVTVDSADVITCSNYEDILKKAVVYPVYQTYSGGKAEDDEETAKEAVTDFEFGTIASSSFGYVPVTFTYTENETTVSATVQVPVTYSMPAATVAEENSYAVGLYLEQAFAFPETTTKAQAVTYYPASGEAVAGTLDYGEYTDSFSVGETKLDSNKYTFTAAGTYTVEKDRTYSGIVLKDTDSKTVDYEEKLVSFTDAYTVSVAVTATDYTYTVYAVSEDGSTAKLAAGAVPDSGKQYKIQIENTAFSSNESSSLLNEHLKWTVTPETISITQENGAVTFTVPEKTADEQTITLTAAFDGNTVCSYTVTVSAIGSFTVTFDSDGGTEIDAVTVENGEKVTKPATDPEKDGYSFMGWYLDDKEYDFDSAVKADLTLTAEWQELNNSKLSITWNIPTTNDLTLTYDSEKNTITVEETCTSYKWYIDGEVLTDETSQTLDLSKIELGDGYHDIWCDGTITDDDGSVTYGGSVIITVTVVTE